MKNLLTAMMAVCAAIMAIPPAAAADIEWRKNPVFFGTDLQAFNGRPLMLHSRAAYEEACKHGKWGGVMDCQDITAIKVVLCGPGKKYLDRSDRKGTYRAICFSSKEAAEAFIARAR